MRLTPMRLLRIPEPFDSDAFVFEPKIDGFRALAFVEDHVRSAPRGRLWPAVATSRIAALTVTVLMVFACSGAAPVGPTLAERGPEVGRVVRVGQFVRDHLVDEPRPAENVGRHEEPI